MPMLKAILDPTGTNTGNSAYIYNADGQLIQTPQPSAVNGYDDTYDDLLNFNTGTGLYEYLNNTTGLITVMDYYSSTGSGAVLDYLQNVKVRQGQSGSDILVHSLTYTSNIDDDGNAVYPVATAVDYPSDTDPTITITTNWGASSPLAFKPSDWPTKYWNSPLAECKDCYAICQATGSWPFERCNVATNAKGGPRWPGPDDKWPPAFPGND
jgi:hypothetical protein